MSTPKSQFLDTIGLSKLWDKMCETFPSRTGEGATGTWNININGNAATATTAGTAGTADKAADSDKLAGKTPDNYVLKEENLFERGEGENSIISKNCECVASGDSAVAIGWHTTAAGGCSYTEGYYTASNGASAHAEGRDSQANGEVSHAEGHTTKAEGSISHAEGRNTLAKGTTSHAEGRDSKSYGESSHAEGNGTKTFGKVSHSEGMFTIAGVPTDNSTPTVDTSLTDGSASHAEGNGTWAKGTSSHAEGVGTNTTNEAEHAEGKYNVSHTGTIHSVGIGTSNTDRKNAHEITTDGKHYIVGVGNYDGVTLETATSLQDVINNKADKSDIPAISTPDWNAQAGKAGYIENRTHYYDSSRLYSFDLSNADITYDDNGNISKVIFHNITYSTYNFFIVNTEHLKNGYTLSESMFLQKEDISSIPNGFFTSYLKENDNQFFDLVCIDFVGDPIDYVFSVIKYTDVIEEFLTTLDEKYIPDTITRNSNLKTINGQSILGEGDIEIKVGPAEDVEVIPQEISYEDLKTLRDGDSLTPGGKYRITDYNPTTATDNTGIAGHRFDIVVTAINSDTLDENAKAVHSESDSYFNDCDLDAWEIKYCLDNDTNRFNWVDDVVGTGVIYYMKDEWGNEAPYDFKNILFSHIGDNWYTFGGRDDDSLTGNSHHNVIKSPTHTGTWTIQPNWFGVECCNNTLGEDCYDNTIGYGCSNNTFGNNCYDNTIGYSCSNNTFGDDCNTNEIEEDCNNNTFGDYCSDNTFGDYCSDNTIGYGCSNNTFGDFCSDNTIGYGCSNNTFGDFCSDNTFGYECTGNTFGDGCYDNTFGYGCSSNTFGYDCYSNTFGDGCSNNTFGDYCSSNTFGYYCSSNTFGYEYYGNTFGDGCYDNTFGDGCYSNTFGYGCYSNTFGDVCYSNTFGYGCYSNTFNYDCRNNKLGEGCHNNKFEFGCSGNTFGNYCSSSEFYEGSCNNTFGYNCINNTLLWYCQYNKFEDTCSNIFLSTDCVRNEFGSGCVFVRIDYGMEIMSLSYSKIDSGVSYIDVYNDSYDYNTLKNIHIRRGVKGTSSSNLLRVEITNYDSDYEITVARNSKGELKIYCEADLIA